MAQDTTKKTKKVQLAFLVDEKEKAAFMAMADREGLSASSLMRRIFRKGVRQMSAQTEAA